MICLARLDTGTVVHLVRFGSGEWRSECCRVDFAWRDGETIGKARQWRGSVQSARLLHYGPDRPVCRDCLRLFDAEVEQVAEWREARP